MFSEKPTTTAERSPPVEGRSLVIAPPLTSNRPVTPGAVVSGPCTKRRAKLDDGPLQTMTASPSASTATAGLDVHPVVLLETRSSRPIEGRPMGAYSRARMTELLPDVVAAKATTKFPAVSVATDGFVTLLVVPVLTSMSV